MCLFSDVFLKYYNGNAIFGTLYLALAAIFIVVININNKLEKYVKLNYSYVCIVHIYVSALYICIGNTLWTQLVILLSGLFAVFLYESMVYLTIQEEKHNGDTITFYHETTHMPISKILLFTYVPIIVLTVLQFIF